MGMRVEDKVSVKFLWAKQEGVDEVPFDATIYSLGEDGVIYVQSDSSKVLYRLESNQYETYD